MSKTTDTAIIIPVYNEESVIKKVVCNALEHFTTVICVNDGSLDRSKDEILQTEALLLDHLTNLGQGGALQTGIDYAKHLDNISYFVTYDADGQHRLSDVLQMVKEMKTADYDIIIGSRFIDSANQVPPLKKTVLRAAVLYTKLSTGLKLSDTHNGLRVFNRRFAEKIDLVNHDMAHASEFLDLIVKHNLKYKEMPVSIEYSEYSKNKGQPIINAVNIVFDLFMNKGK